MLRYPVVIDSYQQLRRVLHPREQNNNIYIIILNSSAFFFFFGYTAEPFHQQPICSLLVIARRQMLQLVPVFVCVCVFVCVHAHRPACVFPLR